MCCSRCENKLQVHEVFIQTLGKKFCLINDINELLASLEALNFSFYFPLKLLKKSVKPLLNTSTSYKNSGGFLNSSLALWNKAEVALKRTKKDCCPPTGVQ